MAAATILVIVTSVLAICEFALLGSDLNGRWILPIAAGCLALTPVIMRLTRSAYSGGYWIPVVGVAMLTAGSLIDAGIYSDGMFWLPAVPVVAAFIVGRKSSLVFAGLGSAAAFIVYLYGPQLFATPTQHTLHFVALVAVTAFIAVLIRVYEQDMETRGTELSDALRRLDGIIKAMPHDLVRLDSNGQVRDHVLRHSVNVQKTSRDLADYLPAGLVTAVNNLQEQLDDDVTARSSLYSNDGQTFELQAVPLGGGESLVLLQDVTARKDLEAVKADFVSVVSHELRTPLTAIVGSLGLVLGGVRGEISADAERSIAMASRNANQLRRLIDDLLDLRKLDAGEMQFQVAPVCVSELLDAVIGLMTAFAETHGVSISVNSIPAVQVMADRQRVVQVLSNLISNAVKFTEAPLQVDIEVEHKGDSVTFRVIDHGPGIRTDFQPHVFARFSQAHRDQPGTKGTGLGLAIAHQIVTRLGGTIGFETEVGVGTTFWFALPEAKHGDNNSNDTAGAHLGA